ncbi:penicillin-binding protein activator [Sphingomicrobium nitratireducens]|uniref:penicillin-binding protein activator n=1 Tax=Sphingomicrobium nitratireducens TaxID=2964666 RepID=UPI00223FD35A|nr:penicillin-binding protein activator [Sphingomicrobium nitratireducens]
MASLAKRQARRSFLLGLGAAAALGLGACQTGPKTDISTPTPTPGTVTPTPGARNNVAVLVPLTGDNAAVGNSIANAAKMALLDSKEESIRLTIYDTAASGGAQGAANAALAAGNRLILGPLLSENVRAVGPIAKAGGVPVIAFSNDEGVAGDNVYIMGFTPTQSIARSVKFARSQGVKRFAGLIPNSLYGQRSVNAFLKTVNDSGGEVAALETYERSRSAIDAAIGRLNGKASTIDAIVIGDGGAVAKSVAPRLQLTGRLIGNELWAADRDLGSVPALRGAIYASVPDGRFDQLSARYRARYNAAPYRLSSLGYDAVLLTVRLARQWPAGGRFPVGELRDKDGFGGVDGIFRFGSDNVAERALEIRRVTQTGTAVADPAASAF